MKVLRVLVEAENQEFHEKLNGCVFINGSRMEGIYTMLEAKSARIKKLEHCLATLAADVEWCDECREALDHCCNEMDLYVFCSPSFQRWELAARQVRIHLYRAQSTLEDSLETAKELTT
jgi:hypothetical protein